jgi:hypothetical protein
VCANASSVVGVEFAGERDRCSQASPSLKPRAVCMTASAKLDETPLLTIAERASL